jgi:hypothetical protein
MVGYTHYESDPRLIWEAEAAMAAGFDVDFGTLRRPLGFRWHRCPNETIVLILVQVLSASNLSKDTTPQ